MLLSCNGSKKWMSKQGYDAGEIRKTDAVGGGRKRNEGQYKVKGNYDAGSEQSEVKEQNQ